MNKKPNRLGEYSPPAIGKQSTKLATAFAAAMLIFAIGSPTNVQAELVQHGVAAGLLSVTSPGITNDDTANVVLDFSINDFRLTGTPSRADYPVQIGASRADDFTGGILMDSIAQNGRNAYGTNLFGTPGVVGAAAGYTMICQASNVEYNVNMAGAWFPYTDYIGGFVRNPSNNAAMTTLVGHPGLVFGRDYITNGNGRGIIDLHSFGYDSRTDGILLTTGGKDENNYGLAQAVASNGTWNVFCKDHGSASAGGMESDPIAFVFIPKTNTHLISGRFYGNGTIDMYSGTSPQFIITPLSGGRWELKVPGHSPTNGILIIGAEGGTSQNQDNIVSYQITAAGDGWEIQSRDTPGNGLQTPGGGVEAIASFVYIPAASPGFSVTPTNNLLTTESGGTASFTVALHSQPRGDVTINVASDSAEGVASPSQLIFTAANWNVPQTVTVTGQDDGGAADGSIPYKIVLSPATSTDGGYNNLNPPDVSVINGDNEVGVTVSATSVTTSEAGGTATFTIRLNTAPAFDVVIGLSSSDVSEGTVAGPVAADFVSFTSGNWDQPQTVTVTGINDSIADGNIGYLIQTAPALSEDSNYQGVNAADVSAVNLDNDKAAIVFSPASGLVVSEAGTTTNFTVVLSSEPTANVTVNLTSSDLSEGSVSPASLTFTPANWFTPKPATLTGVNDATNDGNVSYSINASATGDAIYAALQASIGAQTLDNEGALTLPSGTLTYAIGTPGTAIDAAATLADADTANYNAGSLTVSLTANGSADDRLEIRNVGTATGQISVSGNTVSYEGVVIGTFSGGVGTSPLVVTLNTAATPTAVQALIRSVTFRNVNSSPSLAVRSVSVVLADGQGGTSTASKSIQLRLLRTFSFQEGVDHGLGTYTGAGDIELYGDAPDTAYPTGSAVNGSGIGVAWPGGIQKNIGLLRFDNIIGSGPTQIPSGAIIVSADLILNAADGGHGSPLHRMLVNWDPNTTTWQSIGNGIFPQFNDVCRSAYDSQIGVVSKNGGTETGLITVGVTPDVQAWVNGETNYGWAMTGWDSMGDNFIFSPCEATNRVLRPHLRVRWLPAGTVNTSFRQGVNGYTGNRDTRIGEDTPDVSGTTSPTVFVDGEITGGEADQAQVLMRFDDIVGSAPGQIPAGSTIHAAVLHLSSLGAAGPGDGGRFYALLKPWDDTTSTWTFWGGRGIVADGVDALATPSASAGNATRVPNAPGGFFNFDMTSDVQAWVDNVRPNYGWGIIPWPLGGDGWGIGTSETPEEIGRPQLRVFYTPGSGSVAAVLLKPTVTQSSVTVRFTGTIGSTYTVLRSGSLTGSFTSIGTATVQGDGTATLIDNAPLAGTAFYRVSNP